jgi:hypothetical protein
MKAKIITIKPISSRARTIFKNKMNSNGQCKVTMEGESMIFLNSAHKNTNLVVHKNGDPNWAIVSDQKVAQ